MKRTLYFIFERLQITLYERTVIYILASTLTAVTLINVLFEPTANSSIFDYEPIYALFEEKTAELNQEREIILERYYPQTSQIATATEPVPTDTKTDIESFPKMKEEEVADTTGITNIQTSPIDAININTADISLLIRLPGIGPGIAARIIEYRYEFGRFAEKEDIMKVRGIGKTRFESIKDLITVE